MHIDILPRHKLPTHHKPDNIRYVGFDLSESGKHVHPAEDCREEDRQMEIIECKVSTDYNMKEVEANAHATYIPLANAIKAHGAWNPPSYHQNHSIQPHRINNSENDRPYPRHHHTATTTEPQEQPTAQHQTRTTRQNDIQTGPEDNAEHHHKGTPSLATMARSYPNRSQKRMRKHEYAQEQAETARPAMRERTTPTWGSLPMLDVV